MIFQISKDGSDKCVEIVSPYCGYDLDVTRWRMPRTKEECLDFCFVPDEQFVTSGFFFEV